MTRSRRTTFTALTLAALMSLGACSSDDGTSDNGTGDDGTGDDSGQQAPADGDYTTLDDGVLTVGVPTFPPFVGIEGDQITGPDGEIVYAVAEALGLEVVAEPYEFAALIPALESNRIDIAIGSIFRTEERAQVIDFTDPLYIEPPGVISSDGASTIDELEGLRVGTIQGYNWVDEVQGVLGSDDVTLYPSSAELNQDLQAGRLDAGIDSYGTAVYLLADTDWQVEVLQPDERIPSATSPGQTAILVSKDNPGLTAAIDPIIAELHSSGLIAEALERAGLDPAAAETGEPRLL